MFERDYSTLYDYNLRMRMKPTPEQVQKLELHMLKCVYPCKKTVFEISEQIGLTAKFIKTWFQNRRAWFKRISKKDLSKKSFRNKHDLCKLYKIKNGNYTEGDELHDYPTFRIEDVTLDASSLLSFTMILHPLAGVSLFISVADVILRQQPNMVSSHRHIW